MKRLINYVSIMILALIVTISFSSTGTVFGQLASSPWSLFQRLCQSGSLATGPQCQNGQSQQQLGATTSSSSQSSCPSGFTTLCAQSSTASSAGVCANGFTLQGGICVPTTSSTTANNGCPTNSPLQNGNCVPTTTPSTSIGTCPTNYQSQNGVCVPTTSTTTIP